MKASDFQFVRLFSTHCELDIDDIDVLIVQDDKTDFVSKSGNVITLHSPTTITKTIFNLTYRLYEEKLKNAYKKDSFSLILAKAVHDYVYNGFENIYQQHPLIMSGYKSQIPTVILKEIVEPLLDTKIEILPLFMTKCTFTDSCRIIHSFNDFYDMCNFSSNLIPFSKYPMILCNCFIENKASLLSDIFLKQLEHNLGQEKASKLIKRILLNEDEKPLQHIIDICCSESVEDHFVEQFVEFLKAYGNLTVEENETFVSIIKLQYSKAFSKFAQYDNSLYDNKIQKQWTEWSFLGLIEKQLAGMRGSKREVTELMKDTDKEREKLKQRKKRQKKRSLNTEDLLEISRELYDTKVVEPGILAEKLLNDKRVW